MTSQASQDTVWVIRVLEYVGPRDWVEKTLRTGGVPANGTYHVNRHESAVGVSTGPERISSVTLGDFPEILTKATES